MTEYKSVLPIGLIEAYKMTNFEVLAKPPFILKVGNHSAELKSLFADTKLETGCFITAYNPFSETLSLEINRNAQKNLKQKLHGLGLPVLEGLGSDPSANGRENQVFLFWGFLVRMPRISALNLNKMQLFGAMQTVPLNCCYCVDTVIFDFRVPKKLQPHKFKVVSKELWFCYQRNLCLHKRSCPFSLGPTFPYLP